MSTQSKATIICQTTNSNNQQLFRNQIVLPHYRFLRRISRLRLISTQQFTLRQFYLQRLHRHHDYRRSNLTSTTLIRWNGICGTACSKLLFTVNQSPTQKLMLRRNSDAETHEYFRILMQQRYVCNSSSRFQTRIWKTRQLSTIISTSYNNSACLQRNISNRLWNFHLSFAILWKLFRHLGSPTTWTPPTTCNLQPTNFTTLSDYNGPSTSSTTAFSSPALLCNYLLQKNFTSTSSPPNFIKSTKKQWKPRQ